MKQRFAKPLLILNYSLLIILSSCSVSKQINKQAQNILLKDTAVSTGHIGISIYEPATNTYWYNNNATTYFVPASNTKLFSLYAGMKYLGDSLVGLRYKNVDSKLLFIQPTGDPTFLLPEFTNQPVFSFLQKQSEKQITLLNPKWQEHGLGYGWPWDDYSESYAPERSAMPMYGNLVQFKHNGKKFIATPKYFKAPNEISYLDVSMELDSVDAKYTITREKDKNEFSLKETKQENKRIEIPFVTNLYATTAALLKDTLNKTIFSDPVIYLSKDYSIIHSQPTDSLFKPMMHRSDNFFAEQTLLMASNEHLGYMNDEKIIDTILNFDLKDIPQRPKWVDGSGLSRYNLFTPQDFIYILNKLKNEFGFDRMKNILATGGTGTISNYYKKDAGFIFAKTGTLSNNCALSGYLITNKGKLLIFSVLANNYITGATPIRRAVEKFLQGIRAKY